MQDKWDSLYISYLKNIPIGSINNSREGSGCAVHISSNRYLYGKIEQAMGILDYAKRGRIVNIKEHVYTCRYKIESVNKCTEI
jgi:hypothetical protein